MASRRSAATRWLDHRTTAEACHRHSCHPLCVQFVILDGSAGGAGSVPPTSRALRILSSPNTTETLALSLLFPLNTTQGVLLKPGCWLHSRLHSALLGASPAAACSPQSLAECCARVPLRRPLGLSTAERLVCPPAPLLHPGIELACWFGQARAAAAQKPNTSIRRQLDAWLSWVSAVLSRAVLLHCTAWPADGCKFEPESVKGAHAGTAVCFSWRWCS